MKVTSFKTLFLITIVSLFFAACSSLPKEIPEDLTAQELIQKGQLAFENGHYKESLLYYNTVVERYSGTPDVYLEAKYEIGHLYMKQKKYNAAETVFQEILDIYDVAQPGTLPGAYLKLSQIGMDKIAEKK